MTQERLAGHSHRAVMNIYVGNLKIGVNGDDLRNAFDAYGEVMSVTLMDDAYIGSHQQRTYAYIEMNRAEGENAVAKLDGTRIGGRVVNVVEALPLSPVHNSTGSHHKFRER